jgi:hypothetical protein
LGLVNYTNHISLVLSAVVYNFFEMFVYLCKLCLEVNKLFIIGLSIPVILQYGRHNMLVHVLDVHKDIYDVVTNTLATQKLPDLLTLFNGTGNDDD